MSESMMRIYNFNKEKVELKNNFKLNYPQLIIPPKTNYIDSSNGFQINLIGISENQIFNLTIIDIVDSNLDSCYVQFLDSEKYLFLRQNILDVETSISQLEK